MNEMGFGVWSISKSRFALEARGLTRKVPRACLVRTAVRRHIYAAPNSRTAIGQEVGATHNFAFDYRS